MELKDGARKKIRRKRKQKELWDLSTELTSVRKSSAGQWSQNEHNMQR